MFGDMGIEANLFDMDEHEKGELKTAVDLHKRYRGLIFGGDLVRLDLPAHENGFGILSVDRSEALFYYALLESQPHSAPGRYPFRGLSVDTLYRIRIVWPLAAQSHSRSILDVVERHAVSGEALMRAGMQLPILHPQSILILHLQAAG